jgi:hypothetical protein
MAALQQGLAAALEAHSRESTVVYEAGAFDAECDGRAYGLHTTVRVENIKGNGKLVFRDTYKAGTGNGSNADKYLIFLSEELRGDRDCVFKDSLLSCYILAIPHKPT